jgi:hypothetical protein
MSTIRKKKQPDLVTATNEQITEWKRDIDGMERMLDGKEVSAGVHGRKDLIQDPNHIQHEINKRKELIRVHSPHKLVGAAANAAYKRAKELKEVIANAMPTSRDYFQPYPKGNTPTHRGVDFENTVRRQMAFQSPEMQRNVQEYKHIMASLDPSNPTIRNIESLRRENRRVR